MITKIITDNAPAPRGHYSHAVEWNGLIFLSGQLPIGADGTPRPDLSVEEQAKLVLHNLTRVLEDCGSDLNHVLRAGVYVSDIADWDRVDQIYKQVFGDHRPARAVVQVNDLHFGAKLEIELVAVKVHPAAPHAEGEI
ncbi:MAG: RidA family protein [Clostridium sp.]|nr:RidA family protein [Clostridium sp.]